jgi:hypothetical protein
VRRLLLIAAALTVVVYLCAPPRPLALPPVPEIAEPIRGVIHVHTRRSDGSGTREQVARAAARAGLRFVVLTDHGDASRAPQPPAYIDGIFSP